MSESYQSYLISAERFSLFFCALYSELMNGPGSQSLRDCSVYILSQVYIDHTDARICQYFTIPYAIISTILQERNSLDNNSVNIWFVHVITNIFTDL